MLLVVMGMNVVRYGALWTPDDKDLNTQAENPTRPESSTEPTQPRYPLTPMPDGWLSSPIPPEPTPEAVIFGDDNTVRLVGAVPSWDDAQLREAKLRALLPRNFRLSNEFVYHPDALPEPEFSFRTIVLEQSTLFAPSESILATEPPVLAAIASIMITQPDLIVEISGHTDSDGDPLDNLRLGLARAKSISLVLQARAVPPQQIALWSAGESDPIDEVDKSKNRRIELRLFPRPTSELDRRTRDDDG